MENNKMEREFKAPGNEYRSKPFWAWNGKLDKEELHRQLDILKEMGVGGAFIHSRVGLETEYLGKEWMELVADCLDYGRKIGLELWLYDEDRWPSGTAGGKVTEKTANRTKHLQLQIVNASSGIELYEGKTVKGIYSCVLNGHEYSDLKQYQTGDALKDGEKILVLTEEYSPCSDAYNGYTYLNTMKGSAVDDFVDSTYQAYRDELPEKSWNEIKEFSLTSLTGVHTLHVFRKEMLFQYHIRTDWRKNSGNASDIRWNRFTRNCSLMRRGKAPRRSEEITLNSLRNCFF